MLLGLYRLGSMAELREPQSREWENEEGKWRDSPRKENWTHRASSVVTGKVKGRDERWCDVEMKCYILA